MLEPRSEGEWDIGGDTGFWLEHLVRGSARSIRGQVTQFRPLS